MENNISEVFVGDLFRLMNVKFPNSTTIKAKTCLLDYLGVTFAGSKSLEKNCIKLLQYSGGNSSCVTAVGFNKETGLESAAFINGLCSHTLELDDGIRFGALHLGSPIISALLPVAMKEKISGDGLLRGIILGYEAAIRIASTIQPSHTDKGFHPTATCGTIGAAVAICAALELSKEQMHTALSAATSAASGTLKVFGNNSELKPFNTGKAALNGLISAMVARAGFLGPEDVLSGKTGYFQMMAEKYDTRYLKINEEDSYGIDKVYFKPYAACRHCHPAIEAAIKYKNTDNILPEDVHEVKIITYDYVLGKHDHTEVHSVSSAKMSIPYSFAVALCNGTAGLNDFEMRFINDSRVKAVLKKVKVYAEDSLTSQVPKMRPAIIELTTKSGKIYTDRVDYPKGEPENPMTIKEIKDKFVSLAKYRGKQIDGINGIAEIVLGDIKKLNKIYRLL